MQEPDPFTCELQDSFCVERPQYATIKLGFTDCDLNIWKEGKHNIINRFTATSLWYKHYRAYQVDDFEPKLFTKYAFESILCVDVLCSAT